MSFSQESVQLIFIYFKLSTGLKKLIELLIEKGANVNAKDGMQQTPLHYITKLGLLRRRRKNWTRNDNLSNSQFHFYILEPNFMF